MIPDGTISWEMTKPTGVPFADGTRQDCNFYFDGSTIQNPVPYFKSLCDFAASTYGVDLEDFGTWNKALHVHDPSCSFQRDRRYCAQLYFGEQVASTGSAQDSPIREGASLDCIEYEEAWPGRTCEDILDAHGTTIEKFFALNPNVGADCSGLWPDYRYCVATSVLGNAANSSKSSTSGSQASESSSIKHSSPVQDGQPVDCTKRHETRLGDSCSSVAGENNISLDQFYLWNPAVSKDCSAGFWTGYGYCVETAKSAAHAPSSTSHAPTTTAASSAAPTPKQANNAISSCSKYAIAQEGDYCSVS
jgi:hypothetical protein